MISTVTPSSIARLYDTVNAQMTRPTAFHASGARYNIGERLLVVIGEDLDIKRRAGLRIGVPCRQNRHFTRRQNGGKAGGTAVVSNRC